MNLVVNFDIFYNFRFGWTNMNEIGDTTEDFFIIFLILVNFFINMTLKILGGLMKQVKISQLW